MGSTTVRNPVLRADFPDNCVISAKGAFYMTSTSMYFMPGIPIMRSYDLAHWEIVSYVYDTFLDNDAHNLQNGQHIYGKGSWATTLRYHEPYFYVCFNSNDAQNTFMYRTEDPVNGPWERSILPGPHHDPSLLFDDDGRVFLVYGVGTIHIVELTRDAMAIKEGGIAQVFLETPKIDGLNCEGSHLHKINGKYYLMLIQWPRGGRRIQWCYRADSLLGEYEGRIVFDDDMGYRNRGIAQGGLFPGFQNDWYAMLFQDRGACGRSPYVLPIKWEDGWPVIGIDGKAPQAFEVPYQSRTVTPYTSADEFETDSLSLIWQWNHNPDPNGWSLTQRPGYLRLISTSVSSCFERARNSLSQRTFGPACSFETKLDVSGLNSGDHAGIAALQFIFGAIGVCASESGKEIAVWKGKGSEENVEASVPLIQNEVFLKIDFDFEKEIETARFFYSLDGLDWRSLGEPLVMQYRLEHFVGYRPALFCYATKECGGYADFDYYRPFVLKCEN